MSSGDNTLSVALVCPGWPPSAVPNGIVAYVATLVPALQRAGARPIVITPSVKADHKDDFVRYLPHNDRTGWLARKTHGLMRRLAPEVWPQRSFAHALQQESRRLASDQGVAIVEMEESFGWQRYFEVDAQTPRIVLRLHGPWFLNGAANGAKDDAAFRRRDRAEREGLVLAAGVTSPSQQVLDATRKHFDLELADAEVIPNPVPPVEVANRWSSATCEAKSILFVGRFDRHKGADVMIEAFGRVHAKSPDAKLTMVGPDRGLVDDAGRRWSLEEFLAAKLSDSARSNVRWLNFQPQHEIAAMRKRFAVTVVSSRYEVFGIAAAEAMAAGCPLVTTDVGGLGEIVQHERNGLLCRGGDADDLANKILRLFDDADLSQRLGGQATIDATERYHPDVIARKTLDYYRRVIR